MQHHHPWVNKTNFLREAGSSNSQYFMAPHSSTLAWKIPWMEEPGRLQSMRSLRVRHDWAASLSCIGEGNSNPLQCSCLEIPGMGEPGGLPSMGLHRVEHDWSNLAAAAPFPNSFPHTNLFSFSEEGHCEHNLQTSLSPLALLSTPEP